jgi:hypothetical protein
VKDGVGQEGGIGAAEPSGCIDGTIEFVGYRRFERRDLAVPDSGVAKPAPVRGQRIARLPLLDLL